MTSSLIANAMLRDPLPFIVSLTKIPDILLGNGIRLGLFLPNRRCTSHTWLCKPGIRAPAPPPTAHPRRQAVASGTVGSVQCHADVAPATLTSQARRSPARLSPSLPPTSAACEGATRHTGARGPTIVVGCHNHTVLPRSKTAASHRRRRACAPNGPAPACSRSGRTPAPHRAGARSHRDEDAFPCEHRAQRK
jgi:hypothetical protein